MIATDVPLALTVGQIAKRLHVPVHRVQYVIRTRRIHPCVRAGNLRVFSEGDVRQIGSELKRIEADRNGDAPAT